MAVSAANEVVAMPLTRNRVLRYYLDKSILKVVEKANYVAELEPIKPRLTGAAGCLESNTDLVVACKERKWPIWEVPDVIQVFWYDNSVPKLLFIND